MSHHQSPWEQEQSNPAEAFLKVVGTAGIALTALLALGLIAGLLLLLVPANEAIGTIVFSGLLVTVVYVLAHYQGYE